MSDTLVPLSSNMCLSGGADGADLQWGMVAGKAGHSVIHWTFAGHRSNAPLSEQVLLNQAKLDEAIPACERANKTLKRRFPTRSQFGTNLLLRNWFQVAHSDACYAVSTISDRGVVNGGTAWATQMFIDRFDGAACPAYVFCQERGFWHAWGGAEGWQVIYSPPAPTGVWAGIGSRDLHINGKLAIRVLLDYKSSTFRAAL